MFFINCANHFHMRPCRRIADMDAYILLYPHLLFSTHKENNFSSLKDFYIKIRIYQYYIISLIYQTNDYYLIFKNTIMYNLILNQENIKGQLVGSNIIDFDDEGNLLPTYNTGLNKFNAFEVKSSWKVKEYSEQEKAKLFDTYRPNANVSYMDKVTGFVRIYRNPNDGILIIQNGLGLPSSIQSFAIKTK